MTPALEREYRNGLEAALAAGWAILEHGGKSIDAVEASVASLEDYPLFNAGRGAVFTHDGKQEMDASIMDGRKLRAGAVAAVTNIKHPIKLARLVMERTDHIFLAGEGANEFARQMHVEIESDEYFFTEHRWRQLREAIARGDVKLDHSVPGRQLAVSKPIGTVGAVACDRHGHLAAATSTGGMTNKKYGRVGDTPLIGAGNYADDICAVSGTGHGEFFMLGLSAFDVSARMRYAGLPLADAVRETIERLTTIGGEGGLIAVNSKGEFAMLFNSEGMYRGYITSDEPMVTAIYSDEGK
jgi:beta-aspartyl-peptidase (threonine type)